MVMSSSVPLEVVGADEAGALHQRLVAFVHALSGAREARCGVWVEHSYARGAAPAARALLAPRPRPAAVDVCAVDEPPAALAPPADDDEDEDDAPEDEWETRLGALAPAAPHARLASLALDALRRMRLERLTGAPRTASARRAARRLRLALAGAASCSVAPRPAAWLHAALSEHAPPRTRRLYAEVTAELRRAAPGLAARLGAGGPVAGADPLEAVGAPLGPGAGPWLAWLSAGRAAADERWTRRLGALVHVRVLRAPQGDDPAPPDAWGAAMVAALRHALDDLFVEAGEERAVFVGGAGPGAALSVTLGARAAGLLLLAPPHADAEGAPAAWRARAPLLCVCGAGRSAGALRPLCRAPHRRLLEVRGVDHALRLWRAARSRHRLPQPALDAAIAEECARWITETAEGRGAEEESSAPPSPPARSSPERRGETAAAGGGGPLGAADILRLPIVFADDAAPPVTVTSGAARYSRVIVASRGRGPPPAPRGHTQGPPGARAARPVLLRRMMPRTPR